LKEIRKNRLPDRILRNLNLLFRVVKFRSFLYQIRYKKDLFLMVLKKLFPCGFPTLGNIFQSSIGMVVFYIN